MQADGSTARLVSLGLGGGDGGDAREGVLLIGEGAHVVTVLYNGAGHANKKDIQDLKLSNNEHVACREGVGTGMGSESPGVTVIVYL